MKSRRTLVAWSPLVVLLLAGVADAHRERQMASPIRPGPVPDVNRESPHQLVVCKPSSKPTKAEHRDIHQRLLTETGAALAQAQAEEAAWHRNSKLFKRCRYEHIQAAVNAARRRHDIFVLPGVYREEPSRAAPDHQHRRQPGWQLLLRLAPAAPERRQPDRDPRQAEHHARGHGRSTRGRRHRRRLREGHRDPLRPLPGFIVRNLQAKDGNEHGIYVVDSDGYVFDRAVGSYCKDYELFSFASDNGLYTDCEAEGGSDSGVYIGGHPDTSSLGRFSATVQRTKMHHNALGFSGTQGNSVRIVDSDVYDNAIGISFDSEFDHPNFPQRQSVVEDNRIYDNNFDIYAPTSDVPPGGPAYSFFRYPVGTGLWFIGGNDNVIRNNYFYDNKMFAVHARRQPAGNGPGGVLPSPGIDRNSVYGNHIGVDPDGNPLPNAYGLPPGGDYAPGASDLWWDETGDDNCWGPQAGDSGPIVTDPPNAEHAGGLPGPCPFPNNGPPVGGLTFTKLAILASCALVPDPMNPPRYRTADLIYPCPFGQTNDAPYQNRNQAECGNGQVDLGEDCDAGGGYGGGTIGSCEELGQGPGTLACTEASCVYDSTACTAPSCGRYGGAVLRLGKLGTPLADDKFDLILNDVDGTGRAFDPTTEDVSLVIRTDPAPPTPPAVIYSRTIPPGSFTSAGTTYRFVDGAIDIALIGEGTLVNPAQFRAVVHVPTAGPSGLAGISGARTATAILRVGNDCWRGEHPCAFTVTGRSGSCRKAKKP